MIGIWSLLSGGCGLVALLGTPSGTEETIPAQYDISQSYDEKILVLVNQPGWVDSPVNMRKEITNKINAYFKVYFKKMPQTSIIDYETVKEVTGGDFTLENMMPAEIAKKFDAGLVLYVEIIDYQFMRLTSDNFSADIKTVSTLYDGHTGNVLWPKERGGSVVSLAVELEKGAEKTIARLAVANAHCILRNFYDCRRVKYRVPEETKGYEIEAW